MFISNVTTTQQWADTTLGIKPQPVCIKLACSLKYLGLFLCNYHTDKTSKKDTVCIGLYRLPRLQEIFVPVATGKIVALHAVPNQDKNIPMVLSSTKPEYRHVRVKFVMWFLNLFSAKIRKLIFLNMSLRLCLESFHIQFYQYFSLLRNRIITRTREC